MTTTAPTPPCPDLAEAMRRHRAGDLATAEPLYRRVLAAQPDDATALHYYGLLCHHRGRSGEAEQLIRRALALAPAAAEAHANLGLVLKAAGRLEEAVSCCREAIRLAPGDGVASYNLGNALLGLGRIDEAEAAFVRAVSLDRTSADFHAGLGEVLRRQGRTDEAIASLTEATRLRPGWANACNGMGMCHYDRRDLDAAASWYGRALQLAPDHAEALKNLGAVRFEQGDQAGAIAAFRRAIAAAPDYADAHFHLACALMRQGDLREGLAEYEWRRRFPTFPRLPDPRPEWRGETLAGKTILLYGEQGLGDVIQFSRYASGLAAAGARVLLRTQKPLLRLMRSVEGIAEVVDECGPVPACDYACPLLSVPHLLGPASGGIPSRVPYVQADADAAGRWRERLAGMPGLKVGVVWSGDPRPGIPDSARVNRRRSLSLAQLAPLAGIAGVTLVSLQKGAPARELGDAPAGLHLFNAMDEMADMADTASLVANLDLVISVDTAMVHLAGAMAKPVWILSRFDGCWRWLLDRDDSPWYPTARLFRQTAPGDWAGVVERVAAALGREALRPDAGEADSYESLMAELGMTAAPAAAATVALRPSTARADFELGRTIAAAGGVAEAAAAYQRAIAADPEFAEAYNNLGVLLLGAGHDAEAIGACWRAVGLKPRVASFWYNLGNAFSAGGRLADAAAALVRAMELAPAYVEAACNLGGVLSRMGRYADAATACGYALLLRPNHAEAHCNLGLALSGLGRVEDAVDAYRKAVALAPDMVQAQSNLGNALLHLGRFDEAIAAATRAVELDPDFPEAIATLVHLKQHACQWSDGGRDLARLLAAGVNHPGQIAPLALVSLDVTAADQLRCATAWAARFAVGDDERCPTRDDRSDRGRLRVGYLSADFHSHATAHLVSGLFESHDRARVEVFGYSTGPDDGSEARRRLVAAFDHFVDLRQLNDVDAARRIHADGIDILVDLKGYTQHARTRILACRPAPLQVNYLGYPGTMGAPFIDYIVADAVVLPPELQPFFSERAVLLPGTYQCNDGRRPVAEGGPGRAECGLPEDGFVFCCFNNTYKITPAMFDIWMRLLAGLPDSVLWLLEANPVVAANLRREAAARGVAAERLVFAPRRPLPEHLARYPLADLFLDTLPCTGHTTASDALWTGLPLLTCAGATFAGRVAGSLLAALGLPELVTGSLAEYEAEALRLARTPGDLAALRQRLHRARTSSGVFDPARCARSMEAAFARMWRIRADGGEPQAFSVGDGES